MSLVEIPEDLKMPF